ncbi:hypothetical protein VU03_03780 [Desulfobulbus sp. N3]|nr:hypothetical protein [Desulfobulbus sp. N3]
MPEYIAPNGENQNPVIGSLVGELEDQFVTALDDDLNISGAIGALFEFIKKVNPILYAGSVDLEQKNEIFSLLRKMNRVFGPFGAMYSGTGNQSPD